MGWNGGTRIYKHIIDSVYDHVDNFETRKLIHLDLIKLFELEDCDSLDNLLGQEDSFDAAYNELNSETDER